MKPLKLLLALAVILIPLFYALNYFGLLVVKAGVSLFGAHYSLPTRWEGKYSGTTGFMRRNFVVFRNYSALTIEAETITGALQFEVNTPDGTPLFSDSGSYTQNRSVPIDVGQFKHCSVTVRMERFNGQFRVALH